MAAACVCLAGAATAHAATVREFLAGLARPAPDRIVFTELRYSDLLDTPIAISGELEYLGPRRLARHVVNPYQELTVIDGDSVRVLREGEVERSFSLRRAPELRGLLISFAAMLSGDAEGLARHFDITLEEPANEDPNWRLTLEPRRQEMAGRLGAVRIYGKRNSPHCIGIGNKQGQGTVILLGSMASTLSGEIPNQEALERACAEFR